VVLQQQPDTFTGHGSEPDTLFSQAIADNVNLELEWLWLARQVTREEERRYCLERALYINPYSAMAQHELARLNAVNRASTVQSPALRKGTWFAVAILIAMGIALCAIITAFAVA
jgi:hypothetical protein